VRLPGLKKIFVILSLLPLVILFAAGESFAHHRKDIRSVDFSNFTYPYSDPQRGEIILRNGLHKERDSIGKYMTTRIVTLRYADLTGDGRQEAVVNLRMGLNGQLPHQDYYYVFDYHAGKPRQIFYGYREWGTRFYIKGRRSMVIIGPVWSDFSIGPLRPDFIETTIYRWRGSHFVAVSRRKVEKPYRP
jgi:hypothetical protein